MGKVLISTGSLSRLGGGDFYDLSCTIRVMHNLVEESELDGFEFVLLPEWDCENPPLTPSDAPLNCEKHDMKGILRLLHGDSLPILSVHANRDIGSYLCSGEPGKIAKGKRLVEECLIFTKEVGSGLCVFHFWDTLKEKLDLSYLEAARREFQDTFPEVRMCVENIPTKHEGKTPFQIMQSFQHWTLDLKWASLYGEFQLFADEIRKVDNVHVQGRYQGQNLVPTVGSLDYAQALVQIKRNGYSGLYTIELEGKPDYEDILDYISRLKRFVN
jgi:hypothetical protein